MEPTYSRMLQGLDAPLVTVECHIGPGSPATTIVGLPEGAVREARDRVRAALKTSGFDYPQGRIVINLAPANLIKTGTVLDLPIALSILRANQPSSMRSLSQFEWIGELGLNGDVRPTQGSLVCALASQRAKRTLVVPHGAQTELGHLARLHQSAVVAPVGSLREAFELAQTGEIRTPPVAIPPQLQTSLGIFSDIIGQAAAKRALTIAAAGSHHLMMVGPPGSGKTLLARAMAELMPPLTNEQALEVAAIYSCAGLECPAERPFREPHHSASSSALTGGGRTPTPGEVTLAHQGVLFLDELPHFKPSVLDSLREPIESGQAMVSRAGYKVRYPCRFQLVAAMNSCPSGRICLAHACRCTPQQVRRYQGRVSGPLIDRIDLQVMVSAVPASELNAPPEPNPDIADLKARIAQAHDRQLARQGTANGQLPGHEVMRLMREAEVTPRLRQAFAKQSLSVRSIHKVWKVARTIADLDAVETVGDQHLLQALGFRMLDWEGGLGVFV